MLAQSHVDALLKLDKLLNDPKSVRLPGPGLALDLHLTSVGGRESFIVDVNRRGRIKISKCTYQERYQVTEILLRLDIDGPDHTNPDGECIPCPHLHVYREGYADKWAQNIGPTDFSDTTDLDRTLRDFLKYCRVTNVPTPPPSLF